MELLKFILFFGGHYVFFFSLAIFSYGIGRKFMIKSCFDHPLEQFCFCATLGLGFLSHLVFLVGILGILYTWLLCAVIALLLLWCHSTWAELYQGFLQIWRGKYAVRWRGAVFVFLIALVFLPIILMPLYPPTAFDPTLYHLTYAKIYTQVNQIVSTPFLRYAVFPQTNEMLFTLALTLYDDIAAQLVQFLLMCILSLALYVFGSRYFSSRSGMWAVAILLSNPMVLYLGSIGNIDIGMTLFIAMGIFGFFNYCETKKKQWLVLSALFLGWAIGSKYSALFFLFLFGLALIYLGWKSRSLFSHSIFLLIAVGIAFPWYFRNWYYTGNPVYPFFGQIFGYSVWTAQDVQGLFDYLVSTFGMGKGLFSFLMLPWNLTIHQKQFHIEAYYAPIYLLAFPIMFFCLSNAKFRALFFLSFSFTLFWFYTSQILRFLLPIVPILSLLVAVSLEKVMQSFPFRNVIWFRKQRFALIMSIALCSPGLLYAYHTVYRYDFPPPYTLERQRTYLTKWLPSYPAYQYLNESKGRSYTLYALFDENMAYFADGTFMGDWFGPARFGNIYGKLSNPRLLHAELRSLGANYFLIRRDRDHAPLVDMKPLPPAWFNMVYENDHCILYAVLDLD